MCQPLEFDDFPYQDYEGEEEDGVFFSRNDDVIPPIDKSEREELEEQIREDTNSDI